MPKKKLTSKEKLAFLASYREFMNDEQCGVAGLADPCIDPMTYTDANGDHLIHAAAKRGDRATVERLLDAGVDVNRTGDMGCTALHYALSWGQGEIADFLCSRGAANNVRNDFGLLPGQTFARK